MVADIIIIAVFALLFFIDFKRGIAITILNVAGVALTGFLAYHISNFLCIVGLYGICSADLNNKSATND